MIDQKRDGISTDYFYSDLRPVSWDAVHSLSHDLVGWCFRGQSDTGWPLATSIERSASRQKCAPRYIADREKWMLYQFKRRAHHYIVAPPSSEETLEWLALIQHYGGPSRLLDFTHSFYIAAFFAVEQSACDAAIWAINVMQLHGQIDHKLNLGLRTNSTFNDVNSVHTKLCNSVIGKNVDISLVADCEPYRMNERLSAQQGMFLFPTDLNVSFTQNLANTFDVGVSALKPQKPIVFDPNTDITAQVTNGSVMKITLPVSNHKVVLDDLASMNITAETLFPGIDGFARSLHYHLSAFQSR